MIKYKDITQELLIGHPVWGWDDEKECYTQIEHYDPLPEDKGTLFVRAKFIDPKGREYLGYIVEPPLVYDVELFIDGHEVGFNLNSDFLLKKCEEYMKKVLNIEEVDIFPLEYQTDFSSDPSREIRGIFDPYSEENNICIDPSNR